MSASPVVCTVRFISGTHQTNTVRGMRASSTSDYKTAAQALAHKLFANCPSRITAQADCPTSPATRRFLIEPC